MGFLAAGPPNCSKLKKKIVLSSSQDVTKSGNGKRETENRETGNREPEVGNEFTAVIHVRSQNGLRNLVKRVNLTVI